MTSSLSLRDRRERRLKAHQGSCVHALAQEFGRVLRRERIESSRDLGQSSSDVASVVCHERGWPSELLVEITVWPEELPPYGHRVFPVVRIAPEGPIDLHCRVLVSATLLDPSADEILRVCREVQALRARPGEARPYPTHVEQARSPLPVVEQEHDWF